MNSLMQIVLYVIIIRVFVSILWKIIRRFIGGIIDKVAQSYLFQQALVILTVFSSYFIGKQMNRESSAIFLGNEISIVLAILGAYAILYGFLYSEASKEGQEFWGESINEFRVLQHWQLVLLYNRTFQFFLVMILIFPFISSPMFHAATYICTFFSLDITINFEYIERAWEILVVLSVFILASALSTRTSLARKDTLWTEEYFIKKRLRERSREYFKSSLHEGRDYLVGFIQGLLENDSENADDIVGELCIRGILWKYKVELERLSSAKSCRECVMGGMGSNFFKKGYWYKITKNNDKYASYIFSEAINFRSMTKTILSMKNENVNFRTIISLMENKNDIIEQFYKICKEQESIKKILEDRENRWGTEAVDEYFFTNDNFWDTFFNIEHMRSLDDFIRKSEDYTSINNSNAVRHFFLKEYLSKYLELIDNDVNEIRRIPEFSSLGEDNEERIFRTLTKMMDVGLNESRENIIQLIGKLDKKYRVASIIYQVVPYYNSKGINNWSRREILLLRNLVKNEEWKDKKVLNFASSYMEDEDGDYRINKKVIKEMFMDLSNPFKPEILKKYNEIWWLKYNTLLILKYVLNEKQRECINLSFGDTELFYDFLVELAQAMHSIQQVDYFQWPGPFYSVRSNDTLNLLVAEKYITRASFRVLCLIDRFSIIDRCGFLKKFKSLEGWEVYSDVLDYFLLFGEDYNYFKNEKEIRALLLRHIRQKLKIESTIRAIFNELLVESRGVVAFSEYEKNEVKEAWTQIYRQEGRGER